MTSTPSPVECPRVSLTGLKESRPTKKSVTVPPNHQARSIAVANTVLQKAAVGQPRQGVVMRGVKGTLFIPFAESNGGAADGDSAADVDQLHSDPGSRDARLITLDLLCPAGLV